jgi:hypothetical protein
MRIESTLCHQNDPQLSNFPNGESRHQVHITILHSQVGLAPLQFQTFSLQEESFISSFLSSQIREAAIGDEMTSKNQAIVNCFACLNK